MSACLGHYSKPWLLGGREAYPPTLAVDTCSSRRANGELFRSGGSFYVALGRCYSLGFAGVNPGRCNNRQAPILYLLVKPITRVGLLPVTMIQTHLRLRCPRRLARRDVRIGFPNNLLFTPLCGLRISRYRRGDAVPRSQRIGNCAQCRASSCQGCAAPCLSFPNGTGFERTDRTLPAELFGHSTV
jgi:hypothetical protein